MSNLYSDVPPLRSNTRLIKNKIENLFESSDEVKIAVGYVSTKGLQRLDELVKINNIKNIQLVIGMYHVIGIPESIYNIATSLHEKWKKSGVGKIFFVNNMDYHGKEYLFLQDGKPIGAVIGSANLSVLAPEGAALRQYEFADFTTDKNSCEELESHINSIILHCSSEADRLNDFSVVHERIDLLRQMDGIIEITNDEQERYTEMKDKVHFDIPIKAPCYEKRFSDQSRDFAHSNINVCYGKGRKSKNGKVERRNWYEVQITVSKSITSSDEYPKGDPFYLITDDNYKFIAHSTAQNNKQLTAYGNNGNDRVFGHWIKGRLETAGYIEAFDNVDDDTEGKGIVTTEILKKAHMQTMVLTKTTTKEFGNVYDTDANGNVNKKKTTKKLLNVWLVHFKNNEDEN